MRHFLRNTTAACTSLSLALAAPLAAQTADPDLSNLGDATPEECRDMLDRIDLGASPPDAALAQMARLEGVSNACEVLEGLVQAVGPEGVTLLPEGEAAPPLNAGGDAGAAGEAEAEAPGAEMPEETPDENAAQDAAENAVEAAPDASGQAGTDAEVGSEAADAQADMDAEVADEAADAQADMEAEVADEAADAEADMDAGTDEAADVQSDMEAEGADEATDAQADMDAGADDAADVQTDMDAEVADEAPDAQAEMDAEVADEATDAQAEMDAEAADEATDAQAEMDAEAADEAADAQADMDEAADAQADMDAGADDAANAQGDVPADANADADAQAGAEAATDAPADEAATDMPGEPAGTLTEGASAESEAATEEPEMPAALAEDGQASEQTTETVTEESARSSDEDFADTTDETVETQDDSGLSTLEKALIVGAGAVAVGSILRGNREVVNTTPDRVVVETEAGDLQVLKDDNALLRRPGAEVETETYSDGSSRTIVSYDDGSQVVTIRDADLRIVRRIRITPEGQEVVLIDDTTGFQPVDVSALPDGSDDARSVDMRDEAALRDALTMQRDVGRTFSLRQVRDIERVRKLAPAIAVDKITFPTDSAAIPPSQAEELASIGRFIARAVDENPGEIFLIEGHTDAVGSASYNLLLSDRRAESVALALTEYFDVPPENLVIQGYGESDLRVETQEAERANRRAVVRRITPLLQTASR